MDFSLTIYGEGISKLPNFTLVVDGGGATPVVLPVTIISGVPVMLNGLVTHSVEFRVTNPLARDIALTQFTITKDGPAKDKINAVLRFDLMNIAAGAELANFLDIEAIQPVFEGETFQITVTGTE